MEKTIISQTFYSIYFDSYHPDIFLLSNSYSKEKWDSFIDKKKCSFFHLEDDNWIIQSEKKRIISDWISDFNLNINDRISTLLKKEMLWAENDVVYFCINCKTIIETNWKTFRENWLDFLSIKDDVPIIYNEKTKNKAILFYPNGTIIVTKQ